MNDAENHPLDGTYRIHSESTSLEYEENRIDGYTTINEHKTLRTDDGGCIWRSRFTILSDTLVEMVSIADPSQAADDFYLALPDGSNTASKHPRKFTSILDADPDIHNLQKLTGQIETDGMVVYLTLTRIDDNA